MRQGGRRKLEFRVLALFFAAFAVFLYGPIIAVVILSFQGIGGGLTFPMNGISVHWFGKLFEDQMVGDFEGSFVRSFTLALVVMALTVVFSLAAGLAFRKPFRGASVVFYLTVASLIVPSILITLGIGLMFDRAGFEPQWYSSALGAHLTWTLPFGLLIMFAVFNRFDPSYEEAARDLGARPWQVFRYVVLPIIGPSLIGVGLFGFTLSFDEFARTLLAAGVHNTLPLEIFGMTTNATTPVLYALGSVTTGVSFLVITLCLVCISILRLRRLRHGSDAGRGTV